MHPIHTLSNGIRVVAIRTAGPVCHCGLIINTGSRDELAEQHGLAHFVEHTIFKGTPHKSATYILNRLDEVGGELNAYTTKEETALYASFLKSYFERAVELIADMVFCSTFPDKEIEKERDVILDEITSYEDTPSELIFDDFEELAFAGTPLGHNILGITDSVRSFSGRDALRFCQDNYSTGQMALTVYGDIDPDTVVHMAEKYLGWHEAAPRRKSRAAASSFKHFESGKNRDTHQQHVLLGSKAPSSHDPSRLTMSVLSNMLGGPSMNSLLSVALRERNGIAYNVETNYTSFDDTGLFNIYFGTDAANLSRSTEIVRTELDKLCQSAISPTRLSRILRQYTGQLMMSFDNGENIMLSAGRSAILHNHVLSIDEMCQSIRENVSAESLLDVARRTLTPGVLSTLIYK